MQLTKPIAMGYSPAGNKLGSETFKSSWKSHRFWSGSLPGLNILCVCARKIFPSVYCLPVLCTSPCWAMKCVSVTYFIQQQRLINSIFADVLKEPLWRAPRKNLHWENFKGSVLPLSCQQVPSCMTGTPDLPAWGRRTDSASKPVSSICVKNY